MTIIIIIIITIIIRPTIHSLTQSLTGPLDRRWVVQGRWSRDVWRAQRRSFRPPDVARSPAMSQAASAESPTSISN